MQGLFAGRLIRFILPEMPGKVSRKMDVSALAKSGSKTSGDWTAKTEARNKIFYDLSSVFPSKFFGR
jgi:hypothetical protein